MTSQSERRRAVLLADGSSSYVQNDRMLLTLRPSGLAGTCLVYKIAGALANRGGSLDEVYNVAQWVSSRLGTIGVGLEHCHVCIS